MGQPNAACAARRLGAAFVSAGFAPTSACNLLVLPSLVSPGLDPIYSGRRASIGST